MLNQPEAVPSLFSTVVNLWPPTAKNVRRSSTAYLAKIQISLGFSLRALHLSLQGGLPPLTFRSKEERIGDESLMASVSRFVLYQMLCRTQPAHNKPTGFQQ
jgi:hypothetical protein